MAAISPAFRLSTSVSSPKSLTITWARVPATSSSIRHWIGWLKLNTIPGMSASESRILSISSSRERALVHCSRGLSAPTNPVLSTPRASIATPGLPGPRHDRLQLGELLQPLLDFARRLHRLLERDARDQLDVHVERALVHDGHELGAQARDERQRPPTSASSRRRDDDDASSQREGEQRQVERAWPACKTGLSLCTGLERDQAQRPG